MVGHETILKDMRLWLAIRQFYGTQILRMHVSQRCTISYVQRSEASGESDPYSVATI
jgi:hypothetical protein